MALTKIPGNLIETGAISGDVLADGGIATAKLANDAVTTDKVLDANITADKLAATLDLTGKTITVATATAGDNDTTVASTAFVSTAIANLADSAPETLNTLNELAAALGDDANFSTTVTNSIATKLPLAGGTLTGTLNVTGDGEDIIINSADYELMLLGNRGSTGVNLDKAYLRMKAEGTNTVIIDTAGNSYFNGGNVGIGQAPSGHNLLEVRGDISTEWGVSPTNIGMKYVDGSQYYLGLTLVDSGRQTRVVSKSADNTGYIAFDTGASATERMRIESSGQILITNETPSIKFVDSGDSSAQFIQAYGGFLRYYADDNNILSESEHSWWIDGTRKMTLDSSGLLSLAGTSNTEGLKLGTNQRIYGAEGARAIEASSTTLQIGEGYSSSTGVMVGGVGAAFFKRIGSSQGSIFFQQGGIGASANLDSLPNMMMSAAYDNADLEGLKFWVACSASEWRPCVIHAIGASTVSSLTGQTAGWATLRCTHHAGSIQGAVMDSGGGGTFAVNDLGGGTGNSDIEMQVTYTQNGNNRTVISAWCANYGTISGVVRS